MDDLDEIRKRMARKHHTQPEKPILGDRQFNHLYRFAIVTMTLCVFALGIASYAKLHPEPFQWLQEPLHFSMVSQWVDQHLLSMIPVFDFSSEVKETAGSVTYEALGEGRYQASDQRITAVSSGIVMALDAQSITISQDNGIQAIYEGLSEINVALYDHVAKGDVMALSEGPITMTFIQAGQEISYEQALAEN